MSRLTQSVFAGLILFAVIVAYVTIPQEGSFANTSDEGQYFNYAKGVSQNGVSYIPVLLQKYMATPSAQLLPHPGRIGHTLIMASWFKVFPKTYRSLAHLSFVCFLVFLLCSFVFARKYLGVDIALWYTTLLSSSPLLMAASRRVLQDSILNLFWALPFWFFFDYLMTRQRKTFFWFCVVFTVALLIKEASIPLWLFFFAAWLVFKFSTQRDLPWRDAAYLFLPPIAAALIYIIVLGGVNNFVTLVDFVSGLQTIPTGQLNYTYPMFARGPWYKFLVDFLLLSPFVTLLFIGYFYHLLANKKFDKIQAYGLLFFVIIFGLFSNLQHTKIVRFVMSLEITLCLFAVLALCEIFRFKNKNLSLNLVVLSVFLIFFSNIMNYTLIYCQNNTYDTISLWLLLAKKFIPYFYFLPG
jgi:hypothetical protein